MLVLFVLVEAQVVLWRFGRVGVRVKSVEVVRVRKAVGVIGRARMVRRTARAMGRVRVEVSMVGVGAGECAAVNVECA